MQNKVKPFGKNRIRLLSENEKCPRRIVNISGKKRGVVCENPHRKNCIDRNLN